MYEKVNPSHPDKLADRIAGALVDLAYAREESPRVAVEVLLGHGYCYIIAESSVTFKHEDVEPIVQRITGSRLTVRLLSIPQDPILAKNQDGAPRAGDNGIFKGVPVSEEEAWLATFAKKMYERWPTDGKFIVNTDEEQPDPDEENVLVSHHLTICQSSFDPKYNDSDLERLEALMEEVDSRNAFTMLDVVNPLGPWTGGPDVDSGATNRKLGSDMGRAVTGGGLHGKDASKADVSVNILCHLFAQEFGCEVEACCAIGDASIAFRGDDLPGGFINVSYGDVVRRALAFIKDLGGFEKLAEWGLIR